MTNTSIFDDKIRSLQERLLLLPNAEVSNFEGCSSDEISELEKYSGGRFPLAYQAFLKVMGRKGGRLFKGSHAFSAQKYQLRLRDVAEKILASADSEYCLSASSFVFLLHQGYQFMFFDLKNGEDAPVYLVTHQKPKPILLAPHFTEFLENFVSDHRLMS